VIGWAIDDHSCIDLVETAVVGAVAMRGELAAHFTSAQLARFAYDHNLARSVGRTGLCWDDAEQELFWATLKVAFHDRYLWPTKVAAKLAVGDWIDRVHNRRRRHLALGMPSPVDYEIRITRMTQAA
jgi:putative transposase